MNAQTLSPTAGPERTTAFLFTVRDTFYCPKSTTDTVMVNVIPPVKVDAGRDTSIVENQPLQLTAIGNEDIASYSWTPALWLNNAGIANPVATITSSYTDAVTYTVKAVTAQGCSGIDSIRVFIYKTLPGIYIPNAFTPNGDGLNDIFKPALAGIKQLEYFRIFDRRGELLYQTSQSGQGWDGTFHSIQQPSAAYIFEARAVDYLGKIVEKKGTVVLIR